MARVIDLKHRLPDVVNGLDHSSLTQEQSIFQCHDLWIHIAAEAGDEINTHRARSVAQGRGQVAFVAEQLTEQLDLEAFKQLSVVHVT